MERPTPHSVAVCTLIALHSDPSSLIHKPNKVRNDHDIGSITPSSPSQVEEHLSKVIKHLVLTNAEGWKQQDDLHHQSQNNSQAQPQHASYNPTLSTIMSLVDLLNLISGPNNSFHHISTFLLKDLLQSSESIDSLMDLFSALRSTVAKGIVDGDSVHGIYVRKRCLGFDELSFGSVGRFWEAFVSYVNDATVEWDGKHNSNESSNYSVSRDVDMFHGSSAFSELEDRYAPDIRQQWQQETKHDIPSRNNEYNNSTNWPLEPRQISRKLRQECLELSKEMGNIPFAHMEAQLQEILQENPELILAHYLRFMNCAIHGERVGALEHFHRYFDYAMIQERKDRLLRGPQLVDTPSDQTGAGESGANQTTSSSSQSSQQSVMQFSAILLASLFHDFANDEMAHLATEEAVRVAQQSGDGSCLAFALGWLHATTNGDENSGSMNPNGANGETLLTRAVSRAATHNIRSIVAGASFLRARNFFSGGNGNESSQSHTAPSISNTTSGDGTGLRETIPAQAWLSIAAASTQGATVGSNNRNLRMSAPFLSHDTPTLMPNRGEESDDLSEIFAQQHLVSAGLWNSLGDLNFASTTSQMALQCYQDHLSGKQLSYLAREISLSTLYGTGSEKEHLYEMNATKEVQSLATSFQRLGLSGTKPKKGIVSSDQQISPKKSTVLYQKALDKLQDLQMSHRYAPDSSWKNNVAWLLNEWSLRKFDLHVGLSLNATLHSYLPITKQGGILAAIETMGQHSFLLCRRRDWEAAKDLILNKICPLCEANQLHSHRARFLLQAALIELDSKTDHLACALPILFECLTLCERFSMDKIHATALSLLARLLLRFNDTKRAKAILTAVMPTILQHSHAYFCGDAWFTMAKCILTDIKANMSLEDKQSERKVSRSLFKEALSKLNEARILFEKVEDVVRLREIFYLQAQIYHSLGDQHKNRNKSAGKFQELNRKMVKSTLPLWYDAMACIETR